MSEARFDRNEQLFGSEGQRAIREQHVVVIGAGGLGSHVLQQLAYLGVGAITVVDGETLDESNKNRYVTARHQDPNDGLQKVCAAERLVQDIDPKITVTVLAVDFPDRDSLDAVATADCVFGCVDDDKARFIVNEASAHYDRIYIDLASEVLLGAPLRYGGRVFVSRAGSGCLVCRDLLDSAEVATGFQTAAQRADRAALYGISTANAPSGPSVISINAVVASLAVTEYMVLVTGLRPPATQLTYHADRGIVTANIDDPPSDCFYCQGLRNGCVTTDLERYLRIPSRAAA